MKEGEEPSPVNQEYLFDGNSLVLTDDKKSLREVGLLDNRDKLEVEIVIKVSIDV